MHLSMYDERKEGERERERGGIRSPCQHDSSLAWYSFAFAIMRDEVVKGEVHVFFSLLVRPCMPW